MPYLSFAAWKGALERASSKEDSKDERKAGLAAPPELRLYLRSSLESSLEEALSRAPFHAANSCSLLARKCHICHTIMIATRPHCEARSRSRWRPSRPTKSPVRSLLLSRAPFHAANSCSLLARKCHISVPESIEISRDFSLVATALAAVATNEKSREISIDSGTEIWHLRASNEHEFALLRRGGLRWSVKA
jgi:hypothetical protein